MFVSARAVILIVYRSDLVITCFESLTMRSDVLLMFRGIVTVALLESIAMFLSPYFFTHPSGCTRYIVILMPPLAIPSLTEYV